jgi:hypothetical protein
MLETGVGDDDHLGAGMLVEERSYGLVELGEARYDPAFSCEVRTVDDDS